MKSLLQFISRQTWLLPPIFLSISFILSLYQQNMTELSLPILVTPLLITIQVAIVFSLLAIPIISDIYKRTIFLCFFIIIVFSYSDFLFFIHRFKFIDIGTGSFLLQIWLLLIVIFFLFIKRIKKNLLFINKFVFLFSLLAMLFPLFGIAKFELSERLNQPIISSPLKLPETDKSLTSENLPDIYFIVPDSYGTSEVFKNYYNFDNSTFVDFLKKQGFFVPTNHLSNYPKTFLSLASTLNMEYLDYLSVYKNSSDVSIVTPLFNKSNVVTFLKNNNYTYYQMGSWWEFTGYNPQADTNITYKERVITRAKLFNYAIIQSTVLQPLSALVTKDLLLNFVGDARNFTSFQFEQLPKTVELPGPKFVFTHILSPHTPYVFGKNCESVINNTFDKAHEVENYTNQVECINKKLMTAIETIQKNSKKPPIIIIQSDEGPPFLRTRLPKEDSWKDANNDLLKQKMPVFAAYYLPGIPQTEFDSFSSSVNIFRKVFNSYFKTNFEMLEDKSFVFPDVNDLYNFIDVTDRVLK